MIQLPQFIQDLGLILVTAAVVTILFKKLNQPVVLGYLIAGLLLGPHIPFVLSVKDTSAVRVWAEIGVIILLFCLGLELSFKKMAKVGKSVSITAIFEVLFMLSVGFVTGHVLGWSTMDSLFLGGILSISSTTIVVRVFEELGLKSRSFVSLVFGVLVVEDIVAVLILVLLSAVAISQSLSGTELLLSAARLGFFLILWFVVGIYLLPPFIKLIRPLLSDETLVVVSLGLCLLMVITTTKLGFSAAFGAFIMGSLLSETQEGERIEKVMRPVRDLFAAIFFVSVGMLIDPNVIVEYRFEILLITIVLILGKFIGAGTGALISGSGLRSSVQVGLSLTQIGEFSFIIATLGLALNVTSSFLYPIAVAVSTITTFTTPYLVKSADSLYNWAEHKIPMRTLRFIEKYQVAIKNEAHKNNSNKKSLTRVLWRAFGLRIILNTTLVAAIFLLTEKLAAIVIKNILGDSLLSSLFVVVGSLILASPFFWAILFGKTSAGLSDEDQQRVMRLTFGIQLLRGFFTLILLTVFISGFLSTNSLAGVVVLLVFIAILLSGRVSNKLYTDIETRFVESYLGKYKVKQPESELKIPSLALWDVEMVEFTIHPNSRLVGLTLLNSKINENFGVNISMVQRGNKHEIAPTGDWVLMPYDRLFIIGTDEQLSKVKFYIDEKDAVIDNQDHQEIFSLKSVRLIDSSDLVGKTIYDSGIGDSISGKVIGIEHLGERILDPDPKRVLQSGDLLLLVGDVEKINSLDKGV